MNTCCEKCSTINVLGSDIATFCAENGTASVSGMTFSVPIIIAAIATAVVLSISWKVYRKSVLKSNTAVSIAQLNT